MNRPSIAILGAVVAVSSAIAANLTIDGSTVLQTMVGEGINLNHDMWLNGNLKPALDLYTGTNGATLYRIVHECYDWVCKGCTLAQANAQIALLNNLDSATLTSTYETSDMKDLWNTISYLNSKGIRGNQISINPQGWTATWLGGDGGYSSSPNNKITSGLEPQYATMVASMMYYGKVVRGLDFNVFDPLNEPSNSDSREGPTVSQSQADTIYTDIITQLNSFGLTGVVLQGPTTCCQTPDVQGNNRSSAMNSSGTISARVPYYTIHDYPSYQQAAGNPGNTYAGHPWVITETNEACSQGTSACDQGTCPAQGEWSWASQTGDLVLEHIANGFPEDEVWAGTNSYELQENPTPTLNCFYHMSYNSTTGLFTPKKGFYVLGIINSGVKPQMQQVSVSTTLGFTILSFKNTTTGQVSILGHTGGSTASISGVLNSMPTVQAFHEYLTDSGSNNLTQQADVSVSSQAFSASVPANTFFLLKTPDPVTITGSYVGGNVAAAGAVVMQ